MRSPEWHRSAFQAVDHKPFQKNLLKEIRAIIVDILSGFNHTRDVRSKRYLLAVSRFLVEHLHDPGFQLIEISFVVVVFLSRTYQRGADSFGIRSRAGYLVCRGFVSKKVLRYSLYVHNTLIKVCDFCLTVYHEKEHAKNYSAIHFFWYGLVNLVNTK